MTSPEPKKRRKMTPEQRERLAASFAKLKSELKGDAVPETPRETQAQRARLPYVD